MSRPVAAAAFLAALLLAGPARAGDGKKIFLSVDMEPVSSRAIS